MDASPGSAGADPPRRFSVSERRQRNRDEMTAAILDTACEIMRDAGVAALTLHEIARRIGITTPALYSYFASKHALYDALVQRAVRLFREDEEAIYARHPLDWSRIRAWFESRVRLARAHPELYHLAFDHPVPGLVYSAATRAETERIYQAGYEGFMEVVTAGAIAPQLPPRRAYDVLLAARHGVVAEALGKEPHLPAGSGRLSHVVDDVLAVFQAAWAPRAHGRSPPPPGDGAAGEEQHQFSDTVGTVDTPGGATRC
jgi:AcrR family transcriptional regulator